MIQTIIGREFPAKVIPLIEQAKKEILIIVFDWRWYPEQPSYSIQKFNQAIIQKAKSPVSIKVILITKDTARILKEQGVEVSVREFGGLVHSKLILIDDDIVVIGSHNFTYNAFETNFESSVIIKDEFANSEFKKYFKSLWLY
jgi:phosphatidylserine/phosphatidylglycerophosphate/cardiolipin synthase-like enzyme